MVQLVPLLLRRRPPHQALQELAGEVASREPEGERQGSHEDILYFRPTDEPDAPRASYIDRL